MSELEAFATLGFILLVLVAVAVAINTPKQRAPKRRAVSRPACLPKQRKPERRKISGKAYVVDGDGLRIGDVNVRLFGIDAPEQNHPYGQAAKWALVKLCRAQTVHAQIMEKDHYGRTIARCTLDDGRDLSAELVKLGLAIDWPKFSGGTYSSFEAPGVRRKLWLADARQKGRMHIWENFEKRQLRN